MTFFASSRWFQSVLGFKRATIQCIIPEAVSFSLHFLFISHCVFSSPVLLFYTFFFKRSHFNCSLHRVWSDIEWLFSARRSRALFLGLPALNPPGWDSLFVCMCLFVVMGPARAIWIGSLHSHGILLRSGLVKHKCGSVRCCFYESSMIYSFSARALPLLQVCVLSLTRLICHRCLWGWLCVCACVFLDTHLLMVIYAIGSDQKRPFLISFRNRQEVLYSVCVLVGVCAYGRECVWPEVFSSVLWSK